MASNTNGYGGGMGRARGRARGRGVDQSFPAGQVSTSHRQSVTRPLLFRGLSRAFLPKPRIYCGRPWQHFSRIRYGGV
jgi:hypothetical protein